MTSLYSPKRETIKSESKGETVVTGSVVGDKKRNLSFYPPKVCPHCGKEIKS